MNRTWTQRTALLVVTALVLATSMAARCDEPTTTPQSSTAEAVTVVIQEKETADAPQPAGDQVLGDVTIQQQKVPGGTESATITLDLDLVKPGNYWLGVICSPIEDALLLAHLDIEHGILVQEVVDDSPAAKAGLQKQDILILAGDQPLSDMKSLVDTIEKTQENALTLTIIRKGQRQTVEVTPVKRPADKETADEQKLLQDSLRPWVPQIIEQPHAQPDGTKMLFVMPGFVLPEEAKDFPKDLEVTIVKKGDEPAKITVKRGDEQWEVDAKSLDKLPEDIRPHVGQMLGGGVSVTVGEGAVNWSSSFPKPLVLPRITSEILKKSFKVAPNVRFELRGLGDKLPAEVRERIDAQLKDAQEKLEDVPGNIPAETLDMIQQELKELREQIEKLRGDRAEKEPPKMEEGQPPR